MKARVNKTDREWREILTLEQYQVARKKGTEPPFSGKYYDSKESGIYKCVCCGNELFTSEAKYNSGTGWPSFREAISGDKIQTSRDTTHGMVRTEVMCSECGAHLGHVFDDGPQPTGFRYCINSVALDLEKTGE